MQPEKTTHGAIEGTFFFDPEDPIYADHFPGNPVVPGSLIIRAFLLAAENICGGGTPHFLRDFRFRRFVSPGEHPYRIEISGQEAKCSLFTDKSVVATGVIAL